MVKQIALLGFLLGTLVLLFLIASTSATPKSTDPFYPCQTSTDDTNIFGGIINFAVLCNNITGKRVRTAFERSKIYRIAQFVFKLENNKDQNIPANVIGNHSIGKITIHCPGKNSPLRVDSAAFSLTKLVTKSLTISNCNLKYLDWSFLKGFSYLSSLNIVANSSNLHQRFYTLATRTLAKLEIFHLDSVLGLNGFNHTCRKFPAPPPKGPTELYINNCYDVGTDALQNLLKKWVTRTSRRSLESLSLSNNSLTRVPSEVYRYGLVYVEISGNLQPLTLPNLSFYAVAGYSFVPYGNPPTLILSNSKITSISPGAFQGDYRFAYVDLSGNRLTTIDKNAFNFFFDVSYSFRGRLILERIDCSVKNQCNLAWLFPGGSLTSSVDPSNFATCSNGTKFRDLNANNLRYPNGTRCNYP